MGDIPAGLTFTLSLAWTGQALQGDTEFEKDYAAFRHFDATYKRSFSFIFNPSFPLWTDNADEPFLGRNAHRYLGHSCHRPAPDIGLCRYDACFFTLDHADRIRTNLLQIHVKPLDFVQECPDSFITAIAGYTSHFINPHRPSQSYFRDPAVSLWKTAFTHRRTGSKRQYRQSRRHTFPQTAFVTYSLFGLSPDRLEHCDQYYIDIYRLLFSQSAGVDKRTAERFLERHHWSSTDFFETWYQPGAMVVMSTPFPAENFSQKNCECLAANLDRACQSESYDPDCRNSALTTSREAPRLDLIMPTQSQHDSTHYTDKYLDYDQMAEYPPLRYAAPVVTIYGILYEEVIRDTYERLVELQKSKLRSLRGTPLNAPTGQ